MNMIKWIFNPRYLDFIMIPFLILIIFVIVAFVVSYLFVKIELKNNNKSEKKRGRK